MMKRRLPVTSMILAVVSLSSIGRSVAFASRSFRSGSTVSSTTRSSLATDATATVEDYNELPSDFSHRNDALVALAAVRKACKVTNRLQPEVSGDITTVSKLDLSPVTVADFAAQALVLNHLKQSFEEDSFIAEESSIPLDEDDDLAQEVWKASSFDSIELVKTSIDLGKEYERWEQLGGRPRRVWCLDPVDGTKGLMRGRRDGGQYCVALALLEDKVPTVGVLGCPNLPASPTDFNYKWKEGETFDNNQDSRGCIFVASKGGGCYQLPVVPNSAPAVKLEVTPNDGSTMQPAEGRFCVGVEKFSDALGQCAGMAKVLHGEEGLTADGDIIKARRIDSQCKYGVLARAGAEYYVRLPKPGYREWIWDHAAGNVVITEAGGVMTDTDGDEIDFSLGAKMSDKVIGVLASNGGPFHESLVGAFHKQEAERLKLEEQET